MAFTPNSIEITHFMNPNKFFFKYTYLNDNSIEQMQMRLDEILNTNSHYNSTFFSELKENTKVAYFCKPNWIRCQVDKITIINNVQTVIMWSLDYGYPIRITSYKMIKHLPSEWHDIPSPIFCGGLNVSM